MQDIIVKFDFKDFEKLQDCSAFISVWQYPSHEIHERSEWGKIQLIDLTIRFHIDVKNLKKEGEYRGV